MNPPTVKRLPNCMRELPPPIADAQILSRRPSRNAVNPKRPYSFLVEPECNAHGQIADVATLFLTNRECPYRCLMCDLWKNTLTESVAVGDIPEQIRWALTQLPAAGEIKLYNSGNFFDRKAIPAEDYPAIADLVRGFETVIVENHPHLCGEACLRFRDMIAPAKLEIALGLETCHPGLLKLLNKRMTLEDYDRATEFLVGNEIFVRTFLLLKPPFLEEAEGVEWAMRSLDYAFDRGAGCCAIIPTRAGNGTMEFLKREGNFSPPTGRSLEQVLERGLAKERGRVFVDLWDAEPFFACASCKAQRIARLREMNLCQRVLPEVDCPWCPQ